MPASPTAVTDAKPRSRSIETRRAARRAKFERERTIVDYLNRGVPVAEIAQGNRVTEKRMRALIKEILARRMPAAPEEYAALQVGRLNKALLVAYSAMSAENLKAVALVVRIVHELDRYHGFAAIGRRRGRGAAPVDAEGAEPFALAGGRGDTASPEPAGEGPQAFDPASTEAAEALAAPLANRPEKAPQALEKMDSALENCAPPTARDAAPEEAETALFAPGGGACAGPSSEAAPPPAPPLRGPAPSAPVAGAQTAPQAIEIAQSAPGNGATPAAPPGGASPPQADAFEGCDGAPAVASGVEHPFAAYPVASVLAPDPATAGGSRPMNIRMPPHGMAVC